MLIVIGIADAPKIGQQFENGGLGDSCHARSGIDSATLY